MTHSYLERELKYDVPPDFIVPDIADLVPEGGRLEATSEHLRSDYFDTAEHALLAAKMTLRRRTGTTDTGWQLKVPQDPFREEIRVSSVGDDVPEELSDLLLGVTRRQPLGYAATVTTDRRVTRLLDADGRLLAEIDDDNVQARVAGEAARLSAWRQVEVELGEGDLDVLHALGAALRRAGAWLSSSPSKLGRALTLPPSDAPAEEVTPPAGEVVRAYIVEQQRVILAGDLTLRRDNDSAIHKTRVATRRLRSTLRVFGSLFDEASAAAFEVSCAGMPPCSVRCATVRCCGAGSTTWPSPSTRHSCSVQSWPGSTMSSPTTRPSTGGGGTRRRALPGAARRRGALGGTAALDPCGV